MKGRYAKAFESLRRLRHTDIQAARDLYCVSRLSLLTHARRLFVLLDIHVLLEAEREVERQTKRNKFLELWTVPRNRRASVASSIVMFM